MRKPRRKKQTAIATFSGVVRLSFLMRRRITAVLEKNVQLYLMQL